ncbi:ArsR/SmtB family transcription factor [Streptomyces xiamenensis]|uniref:ArsR/SmtB family transcription factor n=1 Tax=Streptomyces TaxID=1883 RepID=UPI0004C8AD7F|nr:winged helix-turn-helix domain-containing protein [Streptomyces sp. NRRL F-2890]
MDTAPDLAAVARLLADGTRARICWALLDRRAWTATEVARHAAVAASTATEHLNLLVSGNLLTEERQGRHRYVRLADPQVADLIETLAALAPNRAAPVRSLSGVRRHEALARARTCYDHLAGEVGVAITDAMTERGLLDWQQGVRLTGDGAVWLAEVGITLPVVRTRRPLVRSCLDWTERRPHLAGVVGAALCRHAFESAWLTRDKSTRAVTVTDAGRAALSAQLSLTL